MDLYKTFGTSKDLEVQGVEIHFGKSIFKVARLGGANKRYKEIAQNLLKPHQRQMDLGILDEEIQKEILIKSFVKGALKGWENVTDKDGKELKFSEENAIKLFQDLPDLYFKLEEVATDIESFQEGEAEKAAKK